MNADDPKPDPKQCYDCIRDGSNDCDSEKPSKATQCATGYCYTNINDKGLFARGCVKDDDDYVKSRDFCSNRKGKCILCSNQEKCNNHKIVEQKCYKATYSISKPIIMDDTYLEKCVISLENLGCYHLERNDNVEKGCMSNLDDKTRDLYKADKDVEICSRDNCNSMVVRELECYQCSKEKDTNCAEPTALTKTKDCSQLSSSCLIGIDKNGTTHRICGMTEDDAKDKFEKYELCQGKTCNDYVFPKNRLKCLQCQGDSDCELKTPESKKNLKAKVCEIHADKEECYTYFENGKLFLLFQFLATFNLKTLKQLISFVIF